MRREKVEWAEFRGGYVDQLASHAERHGIAAQFKIASGDVRCHRLLEASQDGLHARDKLARAEWLADVVVGSQIEALNAIGFGRFGGEENDGDLGQVTARANFLADLKAPIARHHHIQQEKEWRSVPRQRQHLIPPRAHLDRVSGLLQLKAHQTRDVRIVLQAKYRLLHHAPTDLAILILNRNRTLSLGQSSATSRVCDD